MTFSLSLKGLIVVLSIDLLFFVLQVKAQDIPVKPVLIGNGIYLGETKALRNLPVVSPSEYDVMLTKAEKKLLNPKLKYRSYPYASTALPKGPDAVWQRTMGEIKSNAPVNNFEGQTSPYYPPDCNGSVGPNHFFQTVNSTYAIYNKSGTLLAGPTNLNLVFGSVTGATCNDGDPIILYDDQANRWLFVEFSLCGSNDYMLIAVSSSSDPSGTYHAYSFDVADVPDYEKMSVWRDGYYMATNTSPGTDIYIFERDAMIAGLASPKMLAFDNPKRPASIDGFMCVPPIDNDGTFAPAGSPGLFIAMNDDAIGGGSDQLWIYELAVNWVTPATSTFTRTQQLNVTAFDSNFGNDWTNIKQKGTTQEVDAIPMVIMNVPQYRNFGTYQSIVCCHTVDVDGTDHAGIRWYELRKTPPSTTWTIRQQGTYAPDAHSRWMGSIMLNASGEIGLGYSISSAAEYPGIRYCGQSSIANANATGSLDIAEEIIHTGQYSQTGAERWGDYSLLSVDPSDDETFWFTTEYIGASGSRKSKIASFKIDPSPTVVTQAATALTATSAILNGTVNPVGLATNYHFEWGPTIAYGNTTATLSAGSGSVAVAVNGPVSGLVAGTTYHFRLVAANINGTSKGRDLTLIPGAAVLTTTALSNIDRTTAGSGGNITADGGSPVTARGVCWATTINPLVTGNHTSNGTGTGSFTSSITGLVSNTTYYVRAYATNSAGTWYGDNVQFTTLCSPVSTFPYNEGFENGGYIPSCWSQQQVLSSGINWTFVTGNGSGYPATAHSGTYNACLKDNSAADNKAKLISPAINLTAIGSPTLRFWHQQQEWESDQDQLSVYYKTSLSGTWTSLVSYTASVSSWTERTISLPNASAEYYIAFEGNAKYGYGVCIDDVSITGTSLNLPVVTTTAVSSPTATTAISGGNVTSGGTSAVTARGVCWSTAVNPTISNSKTTDGTGTGIFTSSLSGLVPSTLYHVRSYATNSSGTSYGNDVTFTAVDLTAPITTAATAISSTGFTANWNAVDGATGYRLDVSAYLTFSTAVILTEGFNGGTTTPSGWTFTSITDTYTTNSNFGISSPSLKMDSSGDVILTPTLTGTATKLSFWIKGQGTNASSALLVEGYNGTTWITIQNITNSLPTSGTTITYNASSMPVLPPNLVKFRFTYTKSVGNLGFDDVSITYGGLISSFLPGYENLSVPGTSQTVTGLSPDTPYYYRVRAVNGSSSSLNSNTITGTTGKAIQSVATGLWSLPSTWSPNLVPTEIDDIIIKAGKPVTVDIPNAVSSNLTIESGGSLTINPGKALTVNGTLANNALAAGLLIKSNATGTGSLIQNSTGINATAQRWVSQWTDATHGWHHLSSPVAAQAVSPAFTDPIAANYDFYQWDEPTSTWLNLKVNNIPVFVKGTGYLVAYNASDARQFTGELNVAGISFSGLTKTSGTYQGWHLLGNPFSSALKWNDGNWALSNITATAKIWEESAASYIDIFAGTGIIPAMNGFMVETSGAGSLIIPAASRVHDATHWHSFNTERIRLVAYDYDQNTAQESNIRVNAKATDGFDPDFDSYFLAGLAPEFYSTAGRLKLSTNTLPGITDGRAITMGFVKNASENFSIELAENSISGVSTIYLTDKKTGILHDLSKTPVYHFTASEGDDANRFILSFTLVTVIKPGLSSGIRIYTTGKTLFVSQTDAQQGKIRFYNAAGQLLSVKSLSASPTQAVNLSNLSPGVYIITISTDKGLFNQKIVLAD